MKFNKKECIFILLSICLFLVLSSNLTYSKFTYSKEVSGEITTFKKLRIAEVLIINETNGVTLDTNVDFGSASSSTNGIGLMMRDGTQNNEYPIVYYRGNVSNNNVIFADLCWLIVRTTETGGTKLFFNGSVNSDGSCNTPFSSSNSLIVDTVFNASKVSPVYVGYMYNDDIDYRLGTDQTSGGGVISDVIKSRPSLFLLSAQDDYLSHLSDNSIDTETGRHVQNKYDSTIKGVVDDWYEENLLGKPEESLLEDTIWCNDRSVISETYTIENYASKYVFYFAPYTRLVENTTKTPSLECSRDIDKFTVNTSNGNGDLDYPIGLLTADEMSLTGGTVGDSFLSKRYLLFWSLSPGDYASEQSSIFAFGGSGNVGSYQCIISYYIVPSVSLNKEAQITDGDGTLQKPYIILS